MRPQSGGGPSGARCARAGTVTWIQTRSHTNLNPKPPESVSARTSPNSPKGIRTRPLESEPAHTNPNANPNWNPNLNESESVPESACTVEPEMEPKPKLEPNKPKPEPKPDGSATQTCTGTKTRIGTQTLVLNEPARPHNPTGNLASN